MRGGTLTVGTLTATCSSRCGARELRGDILIGAAHRRGHRTSSDQTIHPTGSDFVCFGFKYVDYSFVEGGGALVGASAKEEAAVKGATARRRGGDNGGDGEETGAFLTVDGTRLVDGC